MDKCNNQKIKMCRRLYKEKYNKKHNEICFYILAAAICIFALYTAMSANAQSIPTAPDNMSTSQMSQPNAEVGGMVNTSGGTISTVSINVTTQDYRWKGFVGNISGRFALQDASGSRLFNWNITSVTGEIYATRNSSLLNWNLVECANATVIANEENALSHATSSEDSITKTFGTKAHDSFYVGTVEIAGNSCNSTAMNVNSATQTADFQEILLTDRTNLIYASLLENSKQGFNSQNYDFQMIVAENATQGTTTAVPYYFYVELV